MKLYEHQGKALFLKYGISIPKSKLLSSSKTKFSFKPPLVLKAQVLSGDRKQAGGILFVSRQNQLVPSLKKLFGHSIGSENIQAILAEERISAAHEYYMSISYDTDSRSPVLALSLNGGSGTAKAHIFPIDILVGVPRFFLYDALMQAGFDHGDTSQLIKIIQALWKLFIHEHALLVEINPLFKTKQGEYIAGDAKIILDDEKHNPGARRFLTLPGDIAILASGGGASLLNMDALLHFGGKPANYTEYSGNPPSHVVEELTLRVLSQKGLKGCWVIGGTANFTDIYETLSGFIKGLRKVKPKPTYPIVIRRDGPRQKEAFEMLRTIGKEEGYHFHLFDGSTPMEKTAEIMVRLAYGK